jgi:hypothetical protein
MGTYQTTWALNCGLSENSLHIAKSSAGGRKFPIRGAAIIKPRTTCATSEIIDFSKRCPIAVEY